MNVRVLAVIAIVFSMCVVGPDQAVAMSWPVAVGAEPALRFAVEYQRPDGTVATHTGIDVPAEAGEAVLSADAGTVTFAGRVPSADGGSMLAVTIESNTGLRWSYMPLADMDVTAGQSVSSGEAVGTLAAAGDPSTGTTHVHVGLRQGDMYVDPLSILAVPCPEAGADDEASQPVTAAQPLETADVVPSEVSARSVTDGQGTESETPQPNAAPTVVGEASIPDPTDAPTVVTESAGHEHLVVDGGQAAVSTSRGLSQMQSADEAVHAAGFVRIHACDTSLPWFSRVSALPGTLFGRRLALAVFGLGPAVCASLFRRFRSRVTAPGDTVAAVVGR